MKNKVTDWFPPNVNPVRPGWYGCEVCTIAKSFRKRHYWNGKNWVNSEAAQDVIRVTGFRWRGLKRPFTRGEPRK